MTHEPVPNPPENYQPHPPNMGPQTPSTNNYQPTPPNYPPPPQIPANSRYPQPNYPTGPYQPYPQKPSIVAETVLAIAAIVICGLPGIIGGIVGLIYALKAGEAFTAGNYPE